MALRLWTFALAHAALAALASASQPEPSCAGSSVLQRGRHAQTAEELQELSEPEAGIHSWPCSRGLDCFSFLQESSLREARGKHAKSHAQAVSPSAQQAVSRTIFEPRAELGHEGFKELLIKSGSDKWWDHHYERYYERWLAPYRHAPDLSMMEIGAERGKSLNMWRDYFATSKLIVGLAYGSDGDVRALKNQTRVSVLHGDQSDAGTMRKLVDMGPWDILIDDGSHVPSHMVFSLYSLWKSVKPGGLYVIEDLETNYWKSGSSIYGYSLPSTGIGADANHSAVTKLEQISQVLVRHHIGASGLSVMPGDDLLCSIEWGMNLVALKKCSDAQLAQNPPFAAPSFDAERLSTWLEQARASNPPEMPLDRAPPNFVTSRGAAQDGRSFAEALNQLGSQGHGWSRRLYQREYEAWLAPFRGSAVKVVELGSRLDLSMKLWTKYFEGAGALLVVDRGSSSTPVGGMPSFAAASMPKASDAGLTGLTMHAVASKGPWDVVVDDGSQPGNSTISDLFSLWRAVRPGGMYLIENVAKESWETVSRLDASTSTTNTAPKDVSLVAKLMQVKQVLQRIDIGYNNMSVMPFDGELCSMEWGMNIVALRKCTEEMMQFQPRLEPVQFDADQMGAWMHQAVLSNPVSP